MSKYQADVSAVRAKTTRLKAQRLAHEAQKNSDAVAATNHPEVNLPKNVKRKTRSAATKGTVKAAEMAGQQIDQEATNRRLKNSVQAASAAWSRDQRSFGICAVICRKQIAQRYSG